MKRPLKASLIAAAIAALPLSVGAAGLGRLNVLSALGQPLRAEVELTATPQELQTLTARLASQDAFRQANVTFGPALVGVSASVDQRGGRSVVRLSSDRPINAPFVELLIELDWAAGHLVREYTFLLDPPEMAGSKLVMDSVAPVAAPAAASRPRAQPPAGQQGEGASGRTYSVKRGDTLRSIADGTRGEGVSLDQMLLALYRGNQDAFDGNNMNRLKAGKVLKIPGGSAAAAVSPEDARREVAAHAADFESYRRSLAGVALSRSVGESSAGQASAGRVTPKVAEPAPSGVPQDQVKVSSGEGGKGPATGKLLGSDPSARLQALEEDIVSRDKALKEANVRLAELEQSIQELQKLIELKSGGMARVEQQAAPSGPDASAVAPPEPPPAASAPETPAEPAPAPVAAPVEQPPATQTPQDEPGFLESLMGQPMLLAGGGGIVLLLLGYLGYSRRKGRQEAGNSIEPTAPASVFPSGAALLGTAGGQSVDTGNSSLIQTDFSQSGLSAIDADEGVDPVAEADVYMAYGRDAQAEEILIDALKVDPHRGAVYVKLLEIYAHRKNLKQFESLATDFYGLTGGQGPDWVKAAAIGRKLDAANPLYNESGEHSESVSAPPETQLPADIELPDEAELPLERVSAPATETPPLDAAADGAPSQLQETWALPGELKDYAEAVEPPVEMDFGPATEGLDFNLDLDEPLEAEELPAAETPSAPPADGLEFDLAPELTEAPQAEEGDDNPAMMSTLIDGDSFRLDLDGDLPEPDAALAAHGVPEMDSGVDLSATSLAEPSVDLEQSSLSANLLDFDFDLGAGESHAEAAPIPPVDLSGIDLELDGTETTLEPLDLEPGVAPAGPESDSEEVETKLELAKAYEEMGDQDGARELLQEVLADGSASQQERARAALAQMG